MNPYWTGAFFILGALFGSFANVAILRMPKHESVITPSSHCCSCKNRLNSMTISLFYLGLFSRENADTVVLSFLFVTA